ncbi:MAG: T9SS type A sorting domain-containing protein, partial [Ignavibacteria bacterium]|nr:T9SS type A sorting domain-containing protein [Ignavibacteria bacterium]
IWVGGLLADPLQRGQNITVSGLVRESNNNTMIDSLTSVVIAPSGIPLPSPHIVSVGDIGTLLNGTLSAEMWEGVLIKYVNVLVTNENADGQPGPNGGGNSNFGEIVVTDASTINSRVELQEGNHPNHNLWIASLDSIPGNIRILAGNTFDELIGVLFYSFNNYKLVPRKTDDFVGFTTVEENNPVVTEYFVSQNYPNPFNPVTTIAYSIPQSGFVNLKIYNILGQEVKSLVNMEQSSGNYKVIFDASNLSSGVYLYQINVNDYQVTKKMILMK